MCTPKCFLLTSRKYASLLLPVKSCLYCGSPYCVSCTVCVSCSGSETKVSAAFLVTSRKWCWLTLCEVKVELHCSNRLLTVCVVNACFCAIPSKLPVVLIIVFLSLWLQHSASYTMLWYRHARNTFLTHKYTHTHITFTQLRMSQIFFLTKVSMLQQREDGRGLKEGYWMVVEAGLLLCSLCVCACMCIWRVCDCACVTVSMIYGVCRGEQD